MPSYNKKNYKRFKNNKFQNGKISKKQKRKEKKEYPEDVDRRIKNLKFIKRSKEAQEIQRRQKIIEDKYKIQNKIIDSSDDENEEEKVDAYTQLLSSFKNNDDTDKRIKVIDSSSESDSEDGSKDDDGNEMDDDDAEEEGELFDHQEMGDEEENSDNDELDEENDSVHEDHSNNKDNNENTEELEDIKEEELDEETEKLEKYKSTTSDPFINHFEFELAQDHVDNLLSKPVEVKKTQIYWPKLGKFLVEIPVKLNTNKTTSDISSKKKAVLLENEEVFAKEGDIPTLIINKDLSESNLHIKSQILSNFIQKNQSLTPLQTELLSVINNYQDLYYSQWNFENADEITNVYCLHVLNHMLKTRTRILHHNAKLSAINNKKQIDLVPDSYRDQGLVRPRILILLPFRQSAFKVVTTLASILFGEKQNMSESVINYKRFEEEYTGDTIHFPKRNPKPEDYEKTFAGNTDDTFRMGISLTKKCIKLYTEFYSSDILLASPLGLRMIIGASGDAERDYDFLSSIEILILDQGHLFLAQNWDHLLHVFEHLHLQPQTIRNTNFSRVRFWCLNGFSKFYRQTLLFTSHELPEFRSLYNNAFTNYVGKVRLLNPVVEGTIRNLAVQIPQVFHKIDTTSVETSFDTRFNYFINEILPQFKSPSMAHCMIYVPSYFDYVRLRNYFKSETINFVQICEYTKEGKIARARDMFFHSAAHFLLYSERAHFFRRTRIKGIRHLIMYQPPYWPNFYAEMINLMQNGNQNPHDGLESSMSVTILYTKYDLLQLSSIIGTERASQIFQSRKTTHMFMTGD